MHERAVRPSAYLAVYGLPGGQGCRRRHLVINRARACLSSGVSVGHGRPVPAAGNRSVTVMGRGRSARFGLIAAFSCRFRWVRERVAR